MYTLEFDKEVLKGYIDSIVLSTLKTEDMYGYLILKKIKEISNDQFEIKEATLYVSLKRLEKRGLLKGYWNDNSKTNGGRRRYYKITKDGLNTLKENSKEWNVLKIIIDKFLGGS